MVEKRWFLTFYARSSQWRFRTFLDFRRKRNFAAGIWFTVGVMLSTSSFQHLLSPSFFPASSFLFRAFLSFPGTLLALVSSSEHLNSFHTSSRTYVFSEIFPSQDTFPWLPSPPPEYVVLCNSTSIEHWTRLCSSILETREKNTLFFTVSIDFDHLHRFFCLFHEKLWWTSISLD